MQLYSALTLTLLLKCVTVMLQAELSAYPKTVTASATSSTGTEVEEYTDSIQPPPQKKPRPSLFAHYTDSVPEPEDNRRLETAQSLH